MEVEAGKKDNQAAEDAPQHSLLAKSQCRNPIGGNQPPKLRLRQFTAELSRISVLMLALARVHTLFRGPGLLAC